MSTDYPPPPGQGQPPMGGGSYSGPSGQPAGQSKGFFGALFDFSFSNFVTPMIVKVVYVLALIALVIGYVVVVVAGFVQDVASGIGILVFGLIGFFIYLAFIRMTLEFYYAIVRMSEDINRRLPG